ncbi:hypothetical protein ACQ86N_36555 [Puia sp. P3]|uniref:hypothetical protein n=1 Tax=Puia sp. P3 TaxID=3423952 RepID=UPI003D67F557
MEWGSLTYTDDSSWGPEMDGGVMRPGMRGFRVRRIPAKSQKLTPMPNNIKQFFNTGVTNNTNVNFTKSGQGYTTRLSYSKQYIHGLIPDTKSDRDVLSASATVDLNKFITAECGHYL